MNIAFIVNEFPCLTETFILNQIVGLLGLGHNVDIFATDKKRDDQRQHAAVSQLNLLQRTKYFPVIPRGRMARLRKLTAVIARLILKHPVWLCKCFNFRKYGVYGSVNNLFYLELLMYKKYDIVHCQYGIIGENWSYIKEIMDTKLAVSFRGYDLTKFVFEYGPSFYKELFRAGDVFLPVCQDFAVKLQELGCPGKRIKVLFSGIDVRGFQYQERDFDFQKSIRLLSVGRLVEKKGMRYAILAVGELVKYYPNIEYTIIGKGPLESELKELVKTLNLNGRVRIIDGLVDEEMKNVYYRSHIFILPCVEAADHDQEGIPNVLKEAMATGMPVVSTRHSGIPELVQDGKSGFLVPEKDVEGLVNKCRELIENPQRCVEMGRTGRKFVEESFEISKLNQKLEEFYSQTLNAH